MKWIASLSLFLILSAFLPEGDPKEFLPPGYEDVYVGMTRDSFEKARGTYLKKVDIAGGRYYLQEGGSADSLITGALYLFTAQDSLYELIIEFADDFALPNFMTDFYGPPNLPDGEWLFKREDGSELYIWRYVNRWCVADGRMYK